MTVITQRDNQSAGRLSGLYWSDESASWVVLERATDYGSEEAAIARIDQMAPEEIDDVMIVNYPQIDEIAENAGGEDDDDDDDQWWRR